MTGQVVRKETGQAPIRTPGFEHRYDTGHNVMLDNGVIVTITAIQIVTEWRGTMRRNRTYCEYRGRTAKGIIRRFTDSAIVGVVIDEIPNEPTGNDIPFPDGP